MYEIFIDSHQIDFYNIWYHYQKTPRPGGHKYIVKILANDIDLISKFEKILGISIKNNNFCQMAKKEYMSSFNLIQYMIDILEDRNPNQEFDIQWVFNNIEDVSIKEGNIIILGTASKALDDFK